ncbi:hypothetical protein JANAI62_31190 [Jannaschia pagri]|uniref:Hpt domain-containing protein n=2 Tax=Roseobacteraceae TaxID=2854170 RepID=A0ABQ4NQ88_9RHOB|nr:hypothetical protein JANAI61_31020 [Jannaschia sp. AI_61]GIT96496.1 hypothetical protein JANAI62_31190 [Jannaschia sp. AI_62]
MVDKNRISELRQEIGEEDMAVVFGIFQQEAEETIARIASGLCDQEHAKATHFLRSGALNIGLISLAKQADLAAAVPGNDRAQTAEVLRDTLRRSVESIDVALMQP